MEKVRGIDVSRWQGKIDWKLASQQIDFAAARATIGNYYTDFRFIENYEGCKQYNVPLIAYHVVRYDNNPQSQFARLMDVIEQLHVTHVALDIELPTPAGQSLMHTRTIDNAHAIINLLKGGGYKAIIYTGAWWWNPATKNMEITWPSDIDGWFASYTSEIRIPRGWNDWRFWQYTNAGRIEGISGNVDMNCFNGTKEKFLEWYGNSNSQEGGDPVEVASYKVVLQSNSPITIVQ